jgi:hypothetical protein
MRSTPEALLLAGASWLKTIRSVIKGIQSLKDRE